MRKTRKTNPKLLEEIINTRAEINNIDTTNKTIEIKLKTVFLFWGGEDKIHRHFHLRKTKRKKSQINKIKNEKKNHSSYRNTKDPE